jgi:hypothetical protein
MGLFSRIFGGGGKEKKSAAKPAAASQPSAPAKPRKSEEEVVNQVVEAMLAREKARTEGTFETAGKNIQSILCSDDDCPCTDRRQLVLGKDAYLYISPEVVNFRRNCLTLLELEMAVSRMTSPAEKMGALVYSMPKYLCDVGAKRRGLDLAVALADGQAAAKTGFVPLRTTPKSQARQAEVAAAESQGSGEALETLVSSLLSQDRATRDGALLAARAMANSGNRRGVEALEAAIRRKAGGTVELHSPGIASAMFEDAANARTTLVEIASRKAICKEAKKAGSLLAWIDLQNGENVRALLTDLRRVGGEDQVIEFQLIGTHLQAVAGLKASGA